MKNVTKTIIFVLISTAMGFAETPKQLGAWSVYPTNGNLTSNHVVLLQSTSEEQYKDALGNPVQAKLDVICTKGKLFAIALEPNVAIEEECDDYRWAGYHNPDRFLRRRKEQSIREMGRVGWRAHAVSPFGSFTRQAHAALDRAHFRHAEDGFPIGW